MGLNESPGLLPEGQPETGTLEGAPSSLSERQIFQAVFYSLLCGATSLIPIPFLDDWIFDLVRRYMAREFLRNSGFEPGSLQIRAFVRRPSVWENEGCLGRVGYLLVIAPVKVVFYVLKKLFRKIVFIFTLKEATDRSVHTFHEAYLILLGSMRARNLGVALTGESLGRFRDALLWTLQETDTSALGHIFKTVIKVNRASLSLAGKFLVSTWRRVRGKSAEEARKKAGEAIHREEEVLDQVTRDAAGRILEESGHLESLERRFETCAARLGFVVGSR